MHSTASQASHAKASPAFRCAATPSPDDVAHSAHLAQLRAAAQQRNPIDRHFPFDATQRRTRAEFESALKHDQLRGQPSCFGTLS